jgi:hypothetical protein
MASKRPIVQYMLILGNCTNISGCQQNLVEVQRLRILPLPLQHVPCGQLSLPEQVHCVACWTQRWSLQQTGCDAGHCMPTAPRLLQIRHCCRPVWGLNTLDTHVPWRPLTPECNPNCTCIDQHAHGGRSCFQVCYKSAHFTAAVHVFSYNKTVMIEWHGLHPFSARQCHTCYYWANA